MLGQVLPAEAFGFLLVFTRIGALMMMIPGFAEVGVPARVRLSLALAVSFLIYGAVRNELPTMPAAPLGLGILIFKEVAIGLSIGMLARILLASLHVAGTIIGFQSGLAAAQQFDPSQGSQSALMASFLMIFGIVIVFTSELHLLFLGAMRDSYILFPVQAELLVGDLAQLATETVAASFLLGVQLASPFLVYGIVYNLALGVISRLMPQLPVFFVGIPLNVFAAFAILLMVISAMMAWFVTFFEDRMSVFIA